MTELSFLLDLLLNHKLGKATKDVIKARIDQISQGPTQIFIPASSGQQLQTIAAQQHPTYSIKPMDPAPVAPEQIAQTPAAQEALAQRAKILREAGSLNYRTSNVAPPKAHGVPK